MKSVSIRLREKDLKNLDEKMDEEKKGRSEVVRELIEKGHEFDVLKKYREGKLSIETSAKKLDMTIGEFMDILTDLGIRSPVAFEDYKEGIESLRKNF